MVKGLFFFISESQFTINVNNVSFKFIYVADALSLCLCSNTTDIPSYKIGNVIMRDCKLSYL